MSMQLNDNELPVINLYGLEDLQRMALHQTLAQQGIDDPAAFLELNAVEYKCAFKGSVGMAITITKVTAKQTRAPKKVEA